MISYVLHHHHQHCTNKFIKEYKNFHFLLHNCELSGRKVSNNQWLGEVWMLWLWMPLDTPHSAQLLPVSGRYPPLLSVTGRRCPPLSMRVFSGQGNYYLRKISAGNTEWHLVIPRWTCSHSARSVGTQSATLTLKFEQSSEARESPSRETKLKWMDGITSQRQ